MFRLMKGVGIGILALTAVCANAQLRVSTWNVTNYSGGRFPEFQTSFYGTFQSRQFAPDVIIGQEFLSQTAVNAFVSLLNTAPGSPGDWAAGTFVNGADTDAALFYRTTRVAFLGHVVVATGSSSTSTIPRNLLRYDVRLIGYTGEGATLSLYSSHMKSGPEPLDLSRRLLEAQLLRDNAETLPAGRNFIVGADFNIPTSNEASYQEMVGSQINNLGRFFDPISRPGNWQNNGSFQFIHTQDPAGAGGMDDRFDQLLVSAGLVNGTGFEYIGNSAIPYSSSTWNDPNHSYRCWGNDGTTFNNTLKIVGNTMVGETIAQALVTSADGQGHLPVFMDLRVPPKIASVTTIDFGKTYEGSKPVSRTFEIANSGNATLWGPNGVANLIYSYSLPRGFKGANVVNAIDAAGGPGNQHTIMMDAEIPGARDVMLLVPSNAPEEPVRAIRLVGYVIPKRGR